MYSFDLHYPFPNEVSPYAARLKEEMDQWLTNGFSSLPADLRNKYKSSNLCNAVARSFPRTATYEQLRATGRYLLWATMAEDQHKHTSAGTLKDLCACITAIFRGEATHADDDGIYHHAAITRQEFLALAPFEGWIERFIESFTDYYMNGLVEAQRLMTSGQFAPLPLFTLIRQRSLGSYPYLALMEITGGPVLPVEAVNLPVVARIQSLVARLLTWQNDLFSAQRKKDSSERVTNLVTVLQHELGLSLQAAFEAAVRFHNDDLEEFLVLSKHLPQLGTLQQVVEDYISHMGMLLHGVKTWYQTSTTRYAAEAGQHTVQDTPLSQTLKDTLVARFNSICGPAHVSVEAIEMALYESDETLGLRYPFDILVKPGSTTEIAAIVKLCNEEKLPLLPRGGGTGVTGGALPVQRGVVLSLERLNNILAINKQEQYVVAEAGVTTVELCREVAAAGLYYPVQPTSGGASFIGGNIATNAGSMRSCRFGTTSNYVLNLEVVLPTGEIIWTGSNVSKSSSGFNLTQLFVGSEGILGIITKVVYRLIFPPPREIVMLAAFPELESACKAVLAIKESGVKLFMGELIDKKAIQLTTAYLKQGLSLTGDDVEAHLLLGLEHTGEDMEASYLITTAAIMERYGATNMLVAEDEAQKKQLLRLRQSIGAAMVEYDRHYRDIDVSIPLSLLYKYLLEVTAICVRHHIEPVCFGHAIDGNMHTMLLTRPGNETETDPSIAQAVRSIYEFALANGGVISGEHGIGLLQRPFMELQHPPERMALMKGIKQLLDPNAIMNPGKLL
jgi:glycolate oxidase